MLKQPIMFISGDADQLVPPAHMKELYELSTESSTRDFYSISGGGHNDTFNAAGPTYYDVSYYYYTFIPLLILLSFLFLFRTIICHCYCYLFWCLSCVDSECMYVQYSITYIGSMQRSVMSVFNVYLLVYSLSIWYLLLYYILYYTYLYYEILIQRIREFLERAFGDWKKGGVSHASTATAQCPTLTITYSTDSHSGSTVGGFKITCDIPHIWWRWSHR